MLLYIRYETDRGNLNTQDFSNATWATWAAAEAGVALCQPAVYSTASERRQAAGLATMPGRASSQGGNVATQAAAFESMLKAIEKFLHENERLPSGNASTTQEKAMGQWMKNLAKRAAAEKAQVEQRLNAICPGAYSATTRSGAHRVHIDYMVKDYRPAEDGGTDAALAGQALPADTPWDRGVASCRVCGSIRASVSQPSGCLCWSVPRTKNRCET